MPLMINRADRGVLKPVVDTAAALRAYSYRASTDAQTAFCRCVMNAEDPAAAGDTIDAAVETACGVVQAITQSRVALATSGILPLEPNRCGKIRRLELHAAGDRAAAIEWQKSMARYIARRAGDTDAAGA